jgi:hypothetical protein
MGNTAVDAQVRTAKQRVAEMIPSKDKGDLCQQDLQWID